MGDVQLIGETLGSYRVLSLIGQGGMGQVFLAEHPLIGKRAAAKVLLPQFSNDAEIVNRFFNEARSATLIKHPGIVEIFDFGQHASGCAYIIMEFLEGESLAERLRREKPIPTDLAIEITRQVSGALAAAHGKGIVHRDLKPDNVYLVPDVDMPSGVRVKLLDFGIAKLSGVSTTGGASKTRTGMMMGTPLYMSPEQCRGAGNVDHRADVYSLGCMMFEMLTGRPPFMYEGPGEVIAAHIFQPPPQMAQLVNGIPPLLEKVVQRALEKTADARYQSVSDLSRDLDGIGSGRMSGRVSVATPPPGMTPLSTNTPDARTKMVSTTLQGSASEVTPAPEVATKRGWLIPVGMGIVAAAGALAFVFLRHPEGAPENPPVVAAPKPAVVPDVEQPKPEPKPVEQKPVEPKKVHLSVASEPPGAEVYRAADGVRVGTTPLEMTRTSSDGEIVFLVKLSGYGDERVVLSADRDGSGEAKLHHKHSSSSSSSTSAPSGKKKVKNGVLDPFGN